MACAVDEGERGGGGRRERQKETEREGGGREREREKEREGREGGRESTVAE